MPRQLTPLDPEAVLVIRDVLPNITTLSLPFARFGILKFGGRATIVKLSTGNLAIFSPTPLTPSVYATLSRLGNQVSYIAAPDLEHYLSLQSWSLAFPHARLICPSGLPEKLASQRQQSQSQSQPPSSPSSPPQQQPPPLEFHTVISRTQKSVTPEFDAEFDIEFVDVHPNREIAFFHRPTKTLIQADLLFNLPPKEQYSRTTEGRNVWDWVLGGLGGTGGKAWGQRCMVWYVFGRADREAFGRSVERIRGWGVRNIIPCHGDVVLGDGGEVWERVMKWYLAGKKGR